MARAAFVDEVVAHYLHQARTEVGAFDAAVTRKAIERTDAPRTSG